MRNKALFLVVIFAFICFGNVYGESLKMLKINNKDFSAIRDDVRTESIKSADITVLGIYLSHKCDYFEPCYKHIVLEPEKAVNFNFSIADRVEEYSENGSYVKDNFDFSVSFDFTLNTPTKEKKI